MSSTILPRDRTHSYELQIGALQRGEVAERAGHSVGVSAALDDFCAAAAVDEDIRSSMHAAVLQGGGLFKTVWAETGGVPTSLFAFLPGCQHCLTQAKSAYGRGAESDWLAERMGLMDNTLIPTSPDGITSDLLPEFARLQRAAKSLAGT